MGALENDQNQFPTYPISKTILDSPIQLALSPRPAASPLAPVNTPGTHPTALKRKRTLSSSSAASFKLSPCHTPPLPFPHLPVSLPRQQTIIPASILAPPALPNNQFNFISPLPAPSTFTFVNLRVQDGRLQPEAKRVKRSLAETEEACVAVNLSNVNANGKREGKKEEGEGESADHHPPIAFLREPSASVAATETLTLTQVETEVPTPTQIQAPVPAPVFPFTFRASVPPNSKVNPEPQPKPKPITAPANAKLNWYPRANSIVPTHAPNSNSNANSESHAHARAHPRAAHVVRVPPKEYYGEEHVPAPVGVLSPGDRGWGGEPRMGLESALAWAERVKAESRVRMEVDYPSQTHPVEEERAVYQGRPNTTPTADYVRLLEETFGGGSVLRGEGGKPAVLGSRRKSASKQIAGKGRGGSVGTSVSAGTGTGRGRSVSGSEVDVGMEVDSALGDAHAGDQSLLDNQAEHEAEAGDEDDDDARPSRVSAWIAELQVLVKGKRKMTRADMTSLAQTMQEIKDVDVGEVSVRFLRSLYKTTARLTRLFRRRMDRNSGGVCGRCRSWPRRTCRLGMSMGCATWRGSCCGIGRSSCRPLLRGELLRRHAGRA
ncbi:hypothetical protein C8F04DRAFT_1059972 [Mycena alexandri]|uniref:Uncharacterized protein n=1 Tax=Mycena alexandri TaxID=1745969 RepID=A0AAD6XH05_9AGAR|nr:hypothetical protein C8F04DRAFT_1059972 [Mycena alexandri]